MSDEQEIINCFSLFGTDQAEQLVEDAGGKSKFDYAKFVKKMNKKAKGE
jgi:hypothetical protein